LTVLPLASSVFAESVMVSPTVNVAEGGITATCATGVCLSGDVGVRHDGMTNRPREVAARPRALIAARTREDLE
jgi:hypothetical protein